MSELIYTGLSGPLVYQSQVLTYSGETLTFYYTGTGVFKIASFSFSETDMDESTISCVVSIPGAKPDFSFSWYMDMRGERFYLRSILPPVKKNNESLYYEYTLTFGSERDNLKRYVMANLVAGGQPRIEYTFAFNGTISEFAARFNLNLAANLGTSWQMIVSEGVTTEAKLVLCSRVKMWNLLKEVHNIYGLRWRIYYDATAQKMTILILNEVTDVVEIDHEFEYGAGKGLVEIERLNNTEQVITRLSGRGGEKNVPPSYFHGATSGFPADPDRNEHTDATFYTNILPKCYRDYVQGWNGKVVANPTVAYNQGVADKVAGVWNPVDFMDSDNILTYGIWKDALEDNSEIFPTIQGMTVPEIGRIDEVIDVEEVLNDIYYQEDHSATGNFADVESVEVSQYMHPYTTVSKIIYTDTFEISEEYNKISFKVLQTPNAVRSDGMSYETTITIELVDAITLAQVEFHVFTGSVEDGEAISIPFDGFFSNVVVGSYKLAMTVSVMNNGYSLNTVTELNNVKIENYNSSEETNPYKQTFDIWVKNIWGSTYRAAGHTAETPEDYARRIWTPLYPSSAQGEMIVMWSDGMLAGEDYEFLVTGIYYDTSKTGSHWRLTLKKSDAELKVTDRYLPDKYRNAVAGDHFFFINIVLPQSYIYDAELRVQNYMSAELSKVDVELPAYTCKPSKIFCETFSEVSKLRAGSRIFLRNTNAIGSTAIGLYIRTVTLEYTDESLLPDWTLVVSDKIMAPMNSVSLLKGDVQRLSANVYSSEQTIASVVRQFDRFFLRKDGLSQRSESPTAFDKDVSIGKNLISSDFIPGSIGGTGFGVTRDANGSTILEVDHLRARRTFSATELVINQVTIYGGKHLYSAAAMEVVKVETLATCYRCYLDTKQGTRLNQFIVDDQAFCQRFAPTDNSVISYYWRKVVAVGTDYIDLSNSDYDTGSGIPQVGDNISQLGHRSNKARQSALIIDQLSGGSVVQYAGISGYSWTSKNFVGYGVSASTGEAYLYAYGDVYFGDRDISDPDSTWITFQKAEGDTERKLRIKAEVEFGSGSKGLSNLSEWPELNERISTGEGAAAAITPATQATREQMARALGYASYAQMEAAVVGGTTVIKGGMINTELLKAFSVLANNISTSDGAGERVLISKANNSIHVFDANGVERVLINGKELSAISASGGLFACSNKVGSISHYFVGGESGEFTYGGDNLLASITPSAANNTVIIPSFDISFWAAGINVGDFAYINAYVYAGSLLIGTAQYDYLTHGSNLIVTIPANSMSLAVLTTQVRITFEYAISVDPANLGFEIVLNTTFSQSQGSINYSNNKTEIAKNGIRWMWATNKYFEVSANTSTGAVLMQLRNGDFGLAITDTGLKKMINGSDWVAL